MICLLSGVIFVVFPVGVWRGAVDVKKYIVIRIILNSIKWACLALLCAGAVYMIATQYSVLGYRTFVVQSGSMEPFISVGDVIMVKKMPTYRLNDVVTFVNTYGQTVTHRIISVHGEQLRTKGDANHVVDSDTITQERIIGKVIWHIPHMGRYVALIKTPIGFVLLFLFPVIIFITDELISLKKEE